jgi:crossover junction endodeoxyribonuclease RusA
VKIRLPYPPSLNHLYATFRGRRILSREGRQYKEVVAALVGPVNCATGSLSVSVDAYRPRKSGDLDNTLKALLDSLTGIIWQDDSQIVELHARRFDDKKDPRVEITIEPLRPAEPQEVKDTQ